MSRRLVGAAVVGVLGGAAAIVGTVLPWLSLSVPGGSDPTSGAQTSSINGVLISSGFILAFAAGIAIAAGWLWASPEPRRGAVVLGVLGFSVGTYCVWMLMAKDEALGFGGLGGSATVEPGLYVTLLGAIAGLVAAIVAVMPERVANDDPSEGEPAAVSAE
jgi:Co/Zn/Cd efflux system component